MDTHDSLSASPLVEVGTGLGRQNYFIPGRRFHDDGRETSKLWAGQNRRTEAWRTSASPSGARGTYTLKKDQTSQILEATGSMFRRQQ